MKKYVLFFLLIVGNLFGQEGLHLRGTISFEGSPLANVSIGIKELNVTVQSDSEGRFDLFPVLAGTYELWVSHARFRTSTYKVRVKRDFFIEIDIKRRYYRLESKPGRSLRPVASSYTNDNNEIIRRAVAVGGFSPNYFTFLPSISKGAVLFEAPIIRSQNPALNSVAIEGLVVDMPFHLFGVFQGVDIRYAQSIETFRGVYALKARDLQGASAVEYWLPDNLEGKNSGQAEIGPTQANGKINYYINKNIYGSLSARRTYVDQLIASDSAADTTAYLFDYQGKSVAFLDRRNKLTLVYFGLVDKLTLAGSDSSTFAGGITLMNHGHKVRFDHFLTKKQIFSVEISNRLLERDIGMFDNILKENARTTALSPQFTWEFMPFHLISVGVDLFLEKRDASFSTSSSVFQFSGLPSGVSIDSVDYNSGSTFNYGTFGRYLGEFGPFYFDGSVRFDRYNDLSANLLSLAAMLHWRLTTDLTWSVGSGLYHKRPDVNQLIGASEVQPLKPQSTFKNETGLSYKLLKGLKLTGTVFHYHWYNLIVVDPFVGDPVLSSGVYQNKNNLDSVGAELSMLYQVNSIYLRLGYTYQHMKTAHDFETFHRPHIFNTAFIYFYENMTFTTQLKTWSNLRIIQAAEADIANPIIQLDFRFEHEVGPVFSYFVEVGQITNLIVQNTKGERKEYFNQGFFSQAIFGATDENKAASELPLHLGFGFIWKI